MRRLARNNAACIYIYIHPCVLYIYIVIIYQGWVTNHMGALSFVKFHAHGTNNGLFPLIATAAGSQNSVVREVAESWKGLEFVSRLQIIMVTMGPYHSPHSCRLHVETSRTHTDISTSHRKYGFLASWNKMGTIHEHVL